jgi:tRNA nucleotidyltransferase/poly(A) polymerase
MSLHDELLTRFPRLKRLPPGCYVVGGAIRDLHLGVEPADVDVAAPDPLSAANAAGKRVIRLGSDDHLSAWRVVDAEHVYDFAEILDGDISVDLERRDFTVNAMAVSLHDGSFLDPFHGREDLAARIVRMINPTNFDDDPLRCLKAVRMAVRHDFDIEPATMEAIRSRAASITSVAPERVTYELSVIFTSGRFRKAVALIRATELDRPIFGRVTTLDQAVDDGVTLAGAMALLVEDPRAYGRRWRWSVDLQRQVAALQRLLRTAGDLRVPLYDAGEVVARQLPPLIGDAVSMPDFSIKPLLDGDEIVSITGLAPGAQLGTLKRALLEAQVRNEIKTRPEAVEFVLARRFQ